MPIFQCKIRPYENVYCRDACQKYDINEGCNPKCPYLEKATIVKTIYDVDDQNISFIVTTGKGRAKVVDITEVYNIKVDSPLIFRE